jgi:hypothetical protein
LELLAGLVGGSVPPGSLYYESDSPAYSSVWYVVADDVVSKGESAWFFLVDAREVVYWAQYFALASAPDNYTFFYELRDRLASLSDPGGSFVGDAMVFSKSVPGGLKEWRTLRGEDGWVDVGLGLSSNYQGFHINRFRVPLTFERD